MAPALPAKQQFRRLRRLSEAGFDRQVPSAIYTQKLEPQAPPAMPPQGSQGRALKDIRNVQSGTVDETPLATRPFPMSNARDNHADDIQTDDDDLPDQGHGDESSQNDEEDDGGDQVNVDQYADAIPELEEGDEDNIEEDTAEAQRATKRARLMDYDLRRESVKGFITGAPNMESKQLFVMMLEALHVNSLMMQDVLLMLESIEYGLAKKDLQRPAATTSINEKSTNSVLDATMTGPIMEHMWATSFFVIDGLGPALAKAANYKDVQELQSKAPGLYMRLLTRVKPIMRALRKKANRTAKEALTNPAAYGQLMTVTHPGARPSQHARNMLKGDKWARAQLDSGQDGKIMSNTGFKFAAAQMFDLQDDNGNPPQKLALRAPQLAFLLMWGRKLLRNHVDMPNNSKAKQLWQTEYDIISAKVASTRSNTNIDYTGWPALPGDA